MKGGKRVDNCVKNEEKQPQAVKSCPKCGATPCKEHAVGAKIKSEQVKVYWSSEALDALEEAKKSKKKSPVEVMPTINDGKFEKKGKKKVEVNVKDTTSIG